MPVADLDLDDCDRGDNRGAANTRRTRKPDYFSAAGEACVAVTGDRGKVFRVLVCLWSQPGRFLCDVWSHQWIARTLMATWTIRSDIFDALVDAGRHHGAGAIRVAGVRGAVVECDHLF